ncbi:MAG TPA: hypothetical protein VKM55_23880 [Candidatus Lokiarchaeia archaeon]|nr:hypothetical protein [Candidatus Lokiarchaeia archaeon]
MVYLVYYMNSGNKTTIKVSRKTIDRLHQVLGNIAEKERHRVTLEDAIVHLLDHHDILSKDSRDGEEKLQKDRKSFLALLDHTFKGIEPADYKEYDFDEIGG